MFSTLSVHSSLDAATKISHKLSDNALDSDRKLYTVLVALSLDVLEANEARGVPAFVVYHSSLEVACAVAGISRISGWRAANRLKALGVLDFRPFKGFFRGMVRNSGTLFCVRLNPMEGSKARLSYSDFKAGWKPSWKSYGVMKQTKTLQDQSLRYELLKCFTLSKPSSESRCKYVSPLPENIFGAGLETILDVTSARKEDVHRVVELAADAMCQKLKDEQGRKFYYKLLYCVLRRYKATGEDYSSQVHMVALRASTDAKEGYARKAGALMVSRLKEAVWYQWLLDAPRLKVGLRLG